MFTPHLLQSQTRVQTDRWWRGWAGTGLRCCWDTLSWWSRPRPEGSSGSEPSRCSWESDRSEIGWARLQRHRDVPLEKWQESVWDTEADDAWWDITDLQIWGWWGRRWDSYWSRDTDSAAPVSNERVGKTRIISTDSKERTDLISDQRCLLRCTHTKKTIYSLNYFNSL